MTVPLLGKGLWTLLIEEDETSGESSGTQQADEESSDRTSHVRGGSRTRAAHDLCPSALWRFPLRHVDFSLRYVFRQPR